jgi:hypothetical protein
MQCDTFENRLHELLDRRERPEHDSPLKEHALVCDRCAERLAAQQALFAGLKTAKTPELPPGFTERVLALRRPERKHPFLGKMALTLVALAAALLMALLPAWWLLRAARHGGGDGGNGGPSGGSIARDDPQPAPVDRHLRPPLYGIERRQIVDRDGSDPPSRHDDTALADDDIRAPESPQPESQIDPENTVASDGRRRGLLPGRYADMVPPIDHLAWGLAQDLAAVDEQQAEAVKSVWVERVATPLKPVTSSVTGAINVLRRTLAVGPVWQPDRDPDNKPQAGEPDREHSENLA